MILFLLKGQEKFYYSLMIFLTIIFIDKMLPFLKDIKKNWQFLLCFTSFWSSFFLLYHPFFDYLLNSIIALILSLIAVTTLFLKKSTKYR